MQADGLREIDRADHAGLAGHFGSIFPSCQPRLGLRRSQPRYAPTAVLDLLFDLLLHDLSYGSELPASTNHSLRINLWLFGCDNDAQEQDGRCLTVGSEFLLRIWNYTVSRTGPVHQLQSQSKAFHPKPDEPKAARTTGRTPKQRARQRDDLHQRG